MEKIIAVVIMVVIVIGLIATVIMPQSQQMNQMGAATTTQIGTLNTAMQNNYVKGDAVRAELAIANGNMKEVVIIDDNTAATNRVDIGITSSGLAYIENFVDGDLSTTPAATILSDNLDGANGQPAAPYTTSGATAQITITTGGFGTGQVITASTLTADFVKADALYSKKEVQDTNGVRWILFVKQVVTR